MTHLASSRRKGRNRRILVVDDEECIRRALSTALSAMGYEAVVASSGTEALNLLLRSSFDLVLTDLQMPGMDGWNLTSHIKGRFPNIPVVLMTGQGKEDIMERMKGSCVDSVLFKPFRLDDILKTAQKMLGIELSRGDISYEELSTKEAVRICKAF